ncbi:hypothetical protein [Streptococcus ruminantium]|uniref:hypothetical protein n=1 Tax=Streptococcus ruminantium TaxID=1917441 RepID=UPI001D151CFE|nr:hypothetical protein [Streptococcus ruminantium]
MKIKQVLASLFILIGMMSLLGGCSMTKETLTKEQQDNVVRRIVRGYDPITQVKFIKFSKDIKTGTYLLSFELNDDDRYTTTIKIVNIEQILEKNTAYGLNPISRFSSLEREIELSSEEIVDLSYIKIIYLEE